MTQLSLAFDFLARDNASATMNKIAGAANDVGNKAVNSGKKFDKLGTAIKGVAVVGAAAALKFTKDAIQSASSLEQSTGAVETVFGKAAAAVEDYAKRSGRGIGLARDDYQQLAASVGTQLQRLGQSQEESAQSTDKLITLGADLAATYGGSVSDAIGAVGSLLRGERDPIERYGVGINDAAIKADLLKRGLGNLTGAALEQAKGQATLRLLTEQTSKAQGASTREAGTLQGQTQRLSAQYKDLTGQVGSALLPVLTGLGGKIQNLIDGFQGGTGAGGDLRDAFEKIRAKIKENGPEIREILSALGKFVGFVLVEGIPALVALGAKAASALISIRDAGFKVQASVLDLVSKTLSGFGLIFGALAKIPGPFQEKFQAASVAINSAKTRVDALSTALDVASKPKTAKVAADVRGVDDVRAMRRAIDTVQSKTVFLTTVLKTESQRDATKARNNAVPGRATGGRVTARLPYMVGEKEPELFVPDGSGRILNQRQMGGLARGSVGGLDDAQMMRDRDMRLLRESNQEILAYLRRSPSTLEVLDRAGTLYG